jgi:hypothetical protein
MGRYYMLNEYEVDAVNPETAEMQTEPVHGSLAHALELVRPAFDAELYAEQYGDVTGDAEALLLHFCERGWKEGRNPHVGFDTVSYLHAYRDVDQIGWNPFYHYVLAGRAEKRPVVPAFLPRRAAAAVLGHDPGDWVKLLRGEVDEAFYASQLSVPPDGSFDLVAHFAYRGWLDERKPNQNFDVHAALAGRPELRAGRVNPLVAEIAERPAIPPPDDPDDTGIATTRFPREALFGIGGRLAALAKDAADQYDASRPRYDDPVERDVADHIDRAYYLATYADVRSHGLDPVQHFCRQGWAENRKPAAWFDTEYYLRANTDVAASGVNPFWHYIMEGRKEARRPHRPGGYQREIIERAVDPDTRTRSYERPAATGLLTRIRVERVIKAAWDAASGLVISISHDCYVRVTGGIQLFIADEQARYARQGMVYLHLSPFEPLLRLADPAAVGTLVNLVIDGRFVGVTSYTDITAALKRMERRPDERRLFLVHCLLGHHLPDLLTLQRASASTANAFWVHDYSSICIGYTLLRNDVVYCHAPPPDSMACRICVYGAHRPDHLDHMRAFFEAVRFHVVAPSRAALAIWLEHANLPHLSAVAHEHCDLIDTDEPAADRGADRPTRVAFIGYARAHKGWPLWMELVSRCKRLGLYEFVHIGSAETAADSAGLAHYTVATSPGQPDAMSDAVKDLEIDLVMVLSTWPETFSYVTYEAMAGGADVVCMQDSGNVADTVLRRGRGIVAADEESLFDFFTSLRAVEYVRLCREQGVAIGQLVREGTTATMQLADA